MLINIRVRKASWRGGRASPIDGLPLLEGFMAAVTLKYTDVFHFSRQCQLTILQQAEGLLIRSSKGVTPSVLFNLKAVIDVLSDPLWWTPYGHFNLEYKQLCLHIFGQALPSLFFSSNSANSLGPDCSIPVVGFGAPALCWASGTGNGRGRRERSVATSNL